MQKNSETTDRENAGSNPGTARWSKGRERVTAILTAARELLIEEGVASFFLRNVAARAGLQLGHLQYYFRTKELLVRALMEDVARSYVAEKAQVLAQLPDDPLIRFTTWIDWLLEDAQDRSTQRLFIQLWALNEHMDGGTAGLLDDLYSDDLRIIEELIEAVNPRLLPSERRARAAFIASTVEGTMVAIRGVGPRAWRRIEEEIRVHALRIAQAPGRRS